MTYKYLKLKGRIIEKFATQGRFAAALGMSENSLSRKLTGKTGFSQDDIVKWSELLSISIDELGAYFFS